MTITIKESCIVRPAEDTPTERMWLSNMDLIQANFHLPEAYIYKPDGSSNFFDPKILKEALSKVLVPFYPIAGRLASDDSGRNEINCNGEGVLFVEAEKDYPMSDFQTCTAPSKYMELTPPVDYSKDISFIPLLLIQVTRFSCGGVWLGIAFHHKVADGQAMAHFTNSWSEIARGVDISIPPVHERSLLRARQPPTLKFDHIEFDPTSKFKLKSEDRLSVAILKLLLDLDFLKAKAMNNDQSNVKYTTFEILSAHIWRCASKIRNLSDDQPNLLVIPVDGRHRLKPPLPKGYFGNAIFLATCVVSSGELATEPFTTTVERIHKALSQMNNDYLLSAIDCLEEKNFSIEDDKIIPSTFFINSWVHLPISCTDFGWGRNTFMQPAFGLEGFYILLPSYSGDGCENLSLLACLPEEHIKLLETILTLQNNYLY